MDYTGDNMTSLRRSNRSSALRALRENGAMSRKRLAEMLKLTPAAITGIVSELIAEGLVTEGSPISSTGAGRREIEISFNSEACCALGVFINLRRTVLSGIRLDGSVIFSEELETEPLAKTEETVTLFASRLMELAEQNISGERILGIGIAVRGITSPDGRTVVNSFGALDETNYPLCGRFEEMTGLKAVMVNNVRALFAAHMFLSKDTAASGVFLRCEYGIGASVSVNGEIWRGSSEQCAEIGHIPVVRNGGKLCSCGKRGCLETIASPSAITEDAAAILAGRGQLTDRAPELEEIFTMAQNGDGEIAALVERAVIALAQALKSVIYIIDPEEIVLYGRMFENEYFTARLLSEMYVGVDDGHRTRIGKSRYNRTLENKAAGLAMVEAFLAAGGTV